MSENKLEFIIKKDSAKKDVELTGMTVEAAKAFSVLFNSIINIVRITHPEGVKIKIRSGSAVVSAEGNEEQIAIIQKSYNDIINFRSENKELVNEWRSVQKLISANGLDYEANFYQGSVKTSFLQSLKQTKKLRTRPVSNPIVSTIKFMSGKLIAVGGSNPNIHLENSAGKRITINCTEQNAKKANRFLYENILVSCWSKAGKDDIKYELCESYWHQADFDLLKNGINEFLSISNEIAQLKVLHYKCRELLDKKDYDTFRKFLRLFTHDTTDVNILKTILIVTQSFKEHDKLKEMRLALKEVFDKKVKEHNRLKARSK